MKQLNGKELADFIKQRQARQVRGLRQAHSTFPKLAIVQTKEDPVIDSYIRLKQRYGEDILIEVERHSVASDEAMARIADLNQDVSVHGIIVQLPLDDMSQADEVLNSVVAHKDVDGLSALSTMTPATAKAIDWLLGGYNIDLRGKNIVIVGAGRLVGGPLAKLLKSAGHIVTVVDVTTENGDERIAQADIIVSATGVPGRITDSLVKPGAVVVDAGTTSEHGKIVGDVDDAVYQRTNISMTPKKGGVGPLTVAALFDNVIIAATQAALEN